MLDLDTELDKPLAGVDTYTSQMQISKAPEGWTGLYMNDPSARIRLSHSTLELLHGCERKFQKTKILDNPGAREESPAMSFGKSMGAAWQYYYILRSLGHGVKESLDSAHYMIWMEYFPILEDDRRFLERAVVVMTRSVPFLERMLQEWEIAFFNGKPASELGFSLNIDPRFYFVGYIDLVVRHKHSRRYAIVDAKTTSLRGEDLTPVYKFSDQCLGYSIVLDRIAGESQTSYDVMYWVAQLPSAKADIYLPVVKEYVFPKTLKDRFDWFLKIYLDVNYVRSLEQLDAYPKRGSHCMSFNKVCKFFNECQFTASDKPGYYVVDDTVYEFEYNLEDILADHMERLRNADTY